jgi:hypothetical protein
MVATRPQVDPAARASSRAAALTVVKPSPPAPADGQRLQSKLAAIVSPPKASKLSAVVAEDTRRTGQKVQLALAYHELDEAATAYLVDGSQEALVALLRRCHQVLRDNDDVLDEEQATALLIQVKDFQADQIAHVRETAALLHEIIGEERAKVLARDDDEWRRRTLGDELASLLTFGESDLDFYGLPPLSAEQSVLNVLTLGLVADKHKRDHLRRRWAARHALPDARGGGDGR